MENIHIYFLEDMTFMHPKKASYSIRRKIIHHGHSTDLCFNHVTFNAILAQRT